MNMRWLLGRWFLAWARVRLASPILLGAFIASAHETDNFCLPLDTDLADLGDYLEAVHTTALEEAVAQVNTRIERALRIKDDAKRTVELQRLHDAQTLAEAFRGRFSHPMVEDTLMERALHGEWTRQTYPGRKPSHQDLRMNFSAYATLDPRRWTMLTQSRTVKAYGVYFGTDKLVHLHRLGASYYRMYRSLIKTGLGAEEAYSQVLKYYCETGFLSEQAIFGSFSTGVFSNADLAVNHVGFKFFMNLTEKVLLKGQERAPLVVRCGVFWRLNDHVRLRSGWFAAFFTDHWNEALNPNRYQASMRPGIRRALQRRAQAIVDFYTQKDERPAEPDYFNRLACELSTYYGENYGHSGHFEELMTIGNTCLPALSTGGASPPQ